MPEFALKYFRKEQAREDKRRKRRGVGTGGGAAQTPPPLPSQQVQRLWQKSQSLLNPNMSIPYYSPTLEYVGNYLNFFKKINELARKKFLKNQFKKVFHSIYNPLKF